jgi:hypothetical protein
MDYVPRTLNKDQLKALSILGHQGSRLIALRHKDIDRLLGSTYPGWTQLLDSDDSFVSQALRGFNSKGFAAETAAGRNFPLLSETPIESCDDFMCPSDVERGPQKARVLPGETLF